MNDYRKKQYEVNCELIDMIRDHFTCSSIEDRIQDAVCQELDLDISNFLDAYLDNDADAMVCAITGWDLESLMAKAKVIPDSRHNFYSGGEVPSGEITFPTYGKETLTEQEFVDLLRERWTLPAEALRMVQNTLSVAKDQYESAEDRQDFLWAMFGGAIDVDEEIVRKVVL